MASDLYGTLVSVRELCRFVLNVLRFGFVNLLDFFIHLFLFDASDIE